jgi:hypothetical protein
MLQDLESCFLGRDHEKRIGKMSRRCSHRNIAGLRLILGPLRGNSYRISNDLKTVNLLKVECLHRAQMSLLLV